MRRRLALLVVLAFGLVFALPGVSDAAAPRLTITLTPDQSTSAVGEVVSLSATVTIVDDRGALRAAGWAVRFESSAGWASAPIRTNSAGVARYDYRRTTEGTETIRASVVSTGCEQVTSDATTHSWWEPVLSLTPDIAASYGTPNSQFTVTARLRLGPTALGGELITFRAVSNRGAADEQLDETSDRVTGEASFTWTRNRDMDDAVRVAVPARGLVATGTLRWREILLRLDTSPTRVATVGLPFTVTATLTQGGDPIRGERLDFKAVTVFDIGAAELAAQAVVPIGENATGSDTTDSSGRAYFTWTRPGVTEDEVTVTAAELGVVQVGEVAWRRVVIELSPDLSETTGIAGEEFVLTATVRFNGVLLPNEPIFLEASKADETPSVRTLTAVTNSAGAAQFRWVRQLDGSDDLAVRVRSTSLPAVLWWSSYSLANREVTSETRRPVGQRPATSDRSFAERARETAARASSVPNAPPPIDLMLTQSSARSRAGSVVRLTARVSIPSVSNRPLEGWPVVFRGTAAGGWQSPPVLTDLNGIAVFDRRLDGAVADERFSASLDFPACPVIDAGPIDQDVWKPVIELSPLDATSEVGETCTLVARLFDPEAQDPNGLIGRRLQLTATPSTASEPTVLQVGDTSDSGIATFTWTRQVPTVDTIVVEELITAAEPARATTTHVWVARDVTPPRPRNPGNPNPPVTNPGSPNPPVSNPPVTGNPEPPDPGGGSDPGPPAQPDPDTQDTGGTDPEPPGPTDPDTPTPSPSSPAPSTPTPPPPPPTIDPPPPPTGDTTGIGRPGGELIVNGAGCRPGERAVVYLGDTPIGEAVASQDGTFSLSAVIPNVPLGQYQVRSSCGFTDTPVVDLTAPEAAGSQAPAVGATAAAVLLFFVLAGNAVLRWVTGDVSGGGFHAG